MVFIKKKSFVRKKKKQPRMKSWLHLDIWCHLFLKIERQQRVRTLENISQQSTIGKSARVTEGWGFFVPYGLDMFVDLFFRPKLPCRCKGNLNHAVWAYSLFQSLPFKRHQNCSGEILPAMSNRTPRPDSSQKEKGKKFYRQALCKPVNTVG